MAYAVLASLFTTTDQMLNPDPYSIPCKRETIESLHKNIATLLSFLENSPPHSYQTIKILETKIRDLGYETEDILESHIAKHFRSISGSDHDSIDMLSKALKEVMKGFESLMKDVKEIQGTGNFDGSLSVVSSRLTGKSKFVLLDENFMNQMMEQLVTEDSRLKVLPIVGMGGIGKTTLAKALLDDPFVVGHFDICAWVTISQQYRIQDVVQNLLKDINVRSTKIDIGVDLDGNVGLHKILFKRRYLIVLDDVWETKAWDELQKLFPDNDDGSRIMVTTRQYEVATYAAKSYHEMKLLNDVMSWDLLRQELFAQENCPSELVEIGKEIAKKCHGLPLAISVIGGLLSKEKMTREYWEHVADNIKSVLTEKDDQCLEILSLSYNYLPHHLKPCFLYTAAFPEDDEIPVFWLLKLWVVEGFLKPSSINMENVAEKNLKDLIERNLILVDQLKYNGKPRTCKIHDLVRDLCIKEARKEKFLFVLNNYIDLNPKEVQGQRRLSIHLPPSVIKDKDIEGKFNVIRSISVDVGDDTTVPFSISKLWNLQYLFVYNDDEFIDLPSYIWNMPQLRYLQVQLSSLPPLPTGTEMPVCVLKSLETLFVIENFRCEDEVLVRIPNLRKLKIEYSDDDITDWSYYHLQNLDNLSKLETLRIDFYVICTETLVANLAFPISLKKLTLRGCKISWEHMKIIGDLSNLEILKLRDQAFEGPTWETVEDNFKKLECLKIWSHDSLNEWRVDDANHFPSLRLLYLWRCINLEEIPSSIGEIQTLERIEVEYCSDGVVSSVENIQDSNDDIKLVIRRSE
ncbi:hypothetical protein ACJIZ3_014888 [Penstemon smallii]|uniref:NB-ARC domain-containing protein n=1 Tax=Penstemon smallii TaxID=265156 RepID=A0ABD3RKX1_9LAMI